ncbi:Putative zinc metalloproteasec [Marinibacterium anthonyi]|nr:Putative zinc metalloproteasec [Marinibacterium anthonyi]
MTWSFSVGRLFGSDVRIHVTFLILLAWIGLSVYQSTGPEAALYNMVFVLGLFACVLAHEFGHALMARRFGIRTPSVTLLPIGGLARLERMPEKPWDEIAVALAGPAVNVVIWAVLTLVFGAQLDVIGMTNYTAASFISQLATINLTLAVFNMLPAFPMDGGRVLRAALALKFDRVRATEIASGVGRILAIGLGLLALYLGNPILILIAGFVFFAATSENQDVAARSLSGRFRARDAMITEFHALHPDDPLSAATDAVLRTTQHEFPVTDHHGKAMGFVTRAQIFAALTQDGSNGGADVRAGDLMVTGLPEVAPEASLKQVLDHLAGSAAAVFVVSRDGHLRGYITQENLGELMVVARASMPHV